MKLEQKIDEELARLINPSVLERARTVATVAHEGQRRSDGEPYINHPSRVVDTLFEWGDWDWQTITAAWLHDVVEDCDVSLLKIKEWFGEEVAETVEQLSLVLPSDCAPLRKYQVKRAMLIGKAMTMGQRAILIKMADRLDNLRSLGGAKWSDKSKEGYAIEGVLLASALFARFRTLTGELLAGPHEAVMQEAQRHTSRKVADIVAQGS